jgi:hypothetical protein
MKKKINILFWYGKEDVAVWYKEGHECYGQTFPKKKTHKKNLYNHNFIW